jgi:hypothetical protein
MVKLFGSYDTAFGLTTGIAFIFQTGRPITELGNIPGYGNRERLLSPRGAYGRTDSITTVDLHSEYRIGIGKTSQQISVGMDVFNVFNAQSVVAVYESSEIGNRTYTPAPGHDFLKPIQYQYPRSFQFFLKYTF